MKDYIRERVLREAKEICKTGCTIRDLAKKSVYSKSTVHKDLTERLKKVNPVLYIKVRKIFNKHLEERAEKGGEATKRKWKNEEIFN